MVHPICRTKFAVEIEVVFEKNVCFLLVCFATFGETPTRSVHQTDGNWVLPKLR